jgi:hypothetical protein
MADIFTNDQHKLLVHYDEPNQAGNEPPASGSGVDLPVAPSDPEVMEIDEGPEAESDENPLAGSDPLPDWRVP